MRVLSTTHTARIALSCRYRVTYMPLVPPIINFLARRPMVDKWVYWYCVCGRELCKYEWSRAQARDTCR